MDQLSTNIIQTAADLRHGVKMLDAMLDKGNTDQINQVIAQMQPYLVLLHRQALVTQEALTVYAEISPQIVRVLCEAGVPADAFRLAVDDLCKLSRVLDYYKGRGQTWVNDETTAAFKLSSLAELLKILMMALLPIDANASSFHDGFAKFSDLIMLFIYAYDELRAISSANPLIEECSDMYESMKSRSFRTDYSSAGAADIYACMKSLLEYINFCPFYNNDEEAECRLARFDQSYNRYWRPDIFGDDGQMRYRNMPVVFYAFSKTIDREIAESAPGECNFYTEENFNWGDYPDTVFSSYLDLCQKYRMEAMSIPEYKIKDRVPYISPELLDEMQRDVVKTYLHVRETNIGGCGSLSLKPSGQELLDFMENITDDMEMVNFFLAYLVFMIGLEGTLIEMEILEITIDSAVKMAHETYDMSKVHDAVLVDIERRLEPYVSRLKAIGAVPADWQYLLNSPY